jgi:WhiB family transcriptional regulator, redox-sensing transcriptional regulator
MSDRLCRIDPDHGHIHAKGLCRRCYEQYRVAGRYIAERILSAGDSSWMDRAACRGAPDADVWFPDDPRRAIVWAEAKRRCGGCPVRGECLSWALAIGENAHGVWGGTTPDERRKLAGDRSAGSRDQAA